MSSNNNLKLIESSGSYSLVPAGNKISCPSGYFKVKNEIGQTGDKLWIRLTARNGATPVWEEWAPVPFGNVLYVPVDDTVTTVTVEYHDADDDQWNQLELPATHSGNYSYTSLQPSYREISVSIDGSGNVSLTDEAQTWAYLSNNAQIDALYDNDSGFSGSLEITDQDGNTLASVDSLGAGNGVLSALYIQASVTQITITTGRGTSASCSIASMQQDTATFTSSSSSEPIVLLPTESNSSYSINVVVPAGGDDVPVSYWYDGKTEVPGSPATSSSPLNIVMRTDTPWALCYGDPDPKIIVKRPPSALVGGPGRRGGGS